MYNASFFPVRIPLVSQADKPIACLPWAPGSIQKGGCDCNERRSNSRVHSYETESGVGKFVLTSASPCGGSGGGRGGSSGSGGASSGSGGAAAPATRTRDHLARCPGAMSTRETAWASKRLPPKHMPRAHGLQHISTLGPWFGQIPPQPRGGTLSCRTEHRAGAMPTAATWRSCVCVCRRLHWGVPQLLQGPLCRACLPLKTRSFCTLSCLLVASEQQRKPGRSRDAVRR